MTRYYTWKLHKWLNALVQKIRFWVPVMCKILGMQQLTRSNFCPQWILGVFQGQTISKHYIVLIWSKWSGILSTQREEQVYIVNECILCTLFLIPLTLIFIEFITTEHSMYLFIAYLSQLENIFQVYWVVFFLIVFLSTSIMPDTNTYEAFSKYLLNE